MDEDQLTLENITQDTLDKAWDIWYRFGYPNNKSRCRYPTPTPERVRKSWIIMGANEYRLGIAGHQHAKLWIRRRHTVAANDDFTPIYFSADANDSDKPADTQGQNRQIIESITNAWKDAGLPVEL